MYVWWEVGSGVDKAAEGRSGTKRDLFLLLIFFFNELNYSMCANDPVGGKMVIQKKERIINLYCLNRGLGTDLELCHYVK